MTDDSNNESHPKLVEFRMAKSPFEAKIIAAVLDDAGIPAFVASGMLADEFALSQRMMNLQGVKVQVAEENLEKAEAALAAAKRSGEELLKDVDTDDGADDADVPPPADGPPAGGGKTSAWAAMFAIVAITFGYLWIDSRASYARATRDLLRTTEQTGDGVAQRWKHNGELAMYCVDADRDGLFEEQRFYNRDGVHWSTTFDVDENGMMELVVEVDGEGTIKWYDTDQDGTFERNEVLNAAGEVVAAQERRPGQGYVTVR